MGKSWSIREEAVTNDDALAKVVSVLKLWFRTKYYNDYQGMNSRLDELQAAFFECKITAFR
jgi:dTDP-4-amino-4,6-dideoxygalactose transaminase